MGQAEQPLPVVGILSIGDMGAGIARLLVAKGFTVVSNCTGRRYLHMSCPCSFYRH